MAFLRRKGNAFYLVHNVREGGRVRQLHLANVPESQMTLCGRFPVPTRSWT